MHSLLSGSDEERLLTPLYKPGNTVVRFLFEKTEQLAIIAA